MRPWRASTIVMLSAVALMSPGLPTRALAEDRPGLPVRADAATPDLARPGPVRTTKAHSGPRQAQSPFIDEETPWILPPAPPPEEIETTGVLQCVPFARFMSGIGLHGDAWTWWDKAAGIYARGNQPEPGAVLSFPGIERMPLGHVAVVTQVLSARKILIEHANWPNAYVRHGAISRDIQVADVSESNDWTESGVRVAQPRFSLDYALWSPRSPTLRKFNSIAYLWALPPVERKKAYAAAGMVPNPSATAHGRPMLVLGPLGPGLNDGALGRTLGVSRLGTGTDGRRVFLLHRFVMQ